MDYLSDPRDRILLAQTPSLMAPRFGELPPIEVGQRRFVVGADGLYVQARSRSLNVSLRLSETPAMPYGSVAEYVEMAGGLIPASIRDDLFAEAVRHCPDEWASVVVFDHDAECYRRVQPTVESVSSGHISYQTADYDDDDLCLDVHTHARGAAYFSTTDNVSDSQHALHLSVVIGRCDSRETIEIKTRICVYGQFINVQWEPWE